MKNNLLIAILIILISSRVEAKKVYASTFGYTTSDATAAITNAVISSADTIIVDKQAGDWIVSPISFSVLRTKTIFFEPGVVLRAKTGAFPGTGDCLLKLSGCKNIYIYGYGATFQMNKAEYIALHDGSESRMSIAINGCMNVGIFGLRLNESGGDGIYVTGTGANAYSSNIILQDLNVDKQYRQGISVISAKNLLVQNCWFTNTSGWLPMSGVDLEPNNNSDILTQIVFNRCRFTGNFGNGIQISLQNLSNTSSPIDITFRDCYSAGNHDPSNEYTPSEIDMSSSVNNAVAGTAKFESCLVENSQWAAVFMRKPSNSYFASFDNCVFRNVSQNTSKASNSPVWIEVTDNSNPCPRFGGASFTDCLISYNTNMDFMGSSGNIMTSPGMGNVQFTNVKVVNPNPGVWYDATSGGGSPDVDCKFNFKVATSIPITTVSLVAENTMVKCTSKNSLLESANTSDSVDYPVALTYSTAGTAVPGVDYQLMNGFMVMPANKLSQKDTLFVINNQDTSLSKSILLTPDTSQFLTVSSDPQTVTILECETGINPITAAETCLVYPNPLSDYVVIKMTNAYYGDIRITNEMGQVVISQKGQGQLTRINTSGLSKGIYFVTFSLHEAGIQMKSCKILKN